MLAPTVDQYTISDREEGFLLTRDEMVKFVQLLEHANKLANIYSGTIFARAETGGPSERIKDDDVQHFRSTIYAPLQKVHIFEQPLGADEFFDLVKIGQNTITPLFEVEFEGIKQRLANKNILPPFLINVKFGGLDFRDVNATSWPTISCNPNKKFIDEAQIRTYLLDYFLSELKDRGSPLLLECQCFRDGQRTGLADYFITLHKVWVPVEAKLNILSEKDIIAQVAKYVNIDTFIPTRGLHKGEIFQVRRSPFCLIMDQAGVFTISDTDFIDCTPSSPLFRREHLNHDTIAAIRERIAHFLA